jgi:hypothetical protein
MPQAARAQSPVPRVVPIHTSEWLHLLTWRCCPHHHFPRAMYRSTLAGAQTVQQLTRLTLCRARASAARATPAGARAPHKQQQRGMHSACVASEPAAAVAADAPAGAPARRVARGAADAEPSRCGTPGSTRARAYGVC